MSELSTMLSTVDPSKRLDAELVDHNVDAVVLHGCGITSLQATARLRIYERGPAAYKVEFVATRGESSTVLGSTKVNCGADGDLGVPISAQLNTPPAGVYDLCAVVYCASTSRIISRTNLKTLRSE